MFGWLKKQKSVKREPDAVWRDEASKLEGLCQATRACMDTGQALVLIAHFTETAERVARFFGERALPCQRITVAELLRPHADATPVLLLSDNLPSESQLRALAQPPAARHVLVVERYPIPTREEELLRVVAAFAAPTTLTFHASLDEELLRRFLDTNTLALLDKLGWPPDSPATSSMLSATIRNAQQRIRKHSKGDAPAPNAAQWFQSHFRSE